MPGSAVSDLAGRVLAGRYLLHNPIGTGASGRVYVADDTRLRRRVAVKVLHAALAEDTAFLRRFRAEAQLAASLHHAHIVTVYDWGEDDVPFMVLELLEGGSLRTMLDDGTRLSVAQTARIGRDVAAALEYAHGRGVLHRDIKPANLLFDEHGIVRVADFGLARALAEASWTEPAGAVFGTARYASPEQARGVQLDGRSDLYSLGLVLVEAVTGTVPFSADTTLGTLAARTHESLQAPDAMGVLLPVVERAGALDPDERYPNAATMRAAISDAADTLPPPAPLVLAGMHDREDPHPTRAVPTKDSPRLFDQDKAEIEIITDPVTQPEIAIEATRIDDGRDRARSTQRRLVPYVVALVMLITVAISSFALTRVGAATPLSVPTLVGMNKQDAIDAAQRSHLHARVGRTVAAPDPAGTVIAQSPKPGAFTSGGKVSLTVSSGPAPVAVPNVVGAQWDDAKKQIEALGLAANQKLQYDETHDKGVVLSVEPGAGTSLAPETAVNVVVSNGHAPVTVPDETGDGSSYEKAKADLEAHHFVVNPEVDDFSSSVPKGQVISTDPVGGKPAPYGASVTVHVSKGPDLVTVPDLKGKTLQEATDALHSAGLVVGTVSGWQDTSDTVGKQSPAKSKQVARGSAVDLTFGNRSLVNCIIHPSSC